MSIQYLKSVSRIFALYKQLGEKAMAQVDDQELNWQANEDSNSIATIVKHMWGNMLSRWTDFLTADGEKPWRQRDAEFENDKPTRAQVMKLWEEGWKCLFNTLDSLTAEDMDRIVYIRNEGHTVNEAISRQIAHYAYHVGQIVYVSKLRVTDNWQSLSIPRNKTAEYNAQMFARNKEIRNYTEDWVEKK